MKRSRARAEPGSRPTRHGGGCAPSGPFHGSRRPFEPRAAGWRFVGSSSADLADLALAAKYPVFETPEERGLPSNQLPRFRAAGRAPAKQGATLRRCFVGFYPPTTSAVAAGGEVGWRESSSVIAEPTAMLLRDGWPTIFRTSSDAMRFFAT